ncbi:MAG TPA: type II and III secretion system protein [Hyphomonadaceae bacterium]|nr:type II and III secretion system protein [Hyphomonadaceae bacterium]
MKPKIVKSLLMAASALAFWTLPALAQTIAAPTAEVALSGDGPVARTIVLGLNQAGVVDLPVSAADVVVGDPAIVDAVIRSPRRAFITGREIGQSNLFFFDATGRPILNLHVRVEPNVGELNSMLARAVPNAAIVAESFNGSVVLTGTAPSAASADQAARIAAQFAGTPEQIVNLVAIQGSEQVLLKVRVVEMQRTVLKQLGIDLAASAQFFDGQLQLAAQTLNPFSVNSGLVGGLNTTTAFQNIDPTATFQSAAAALNAFERIGVVRTLAEPNLTAISGESARFLAGGEFPIPVAQQEDVVTIEFRPFGVGLGFTPVVLSGGRISLRMSVEVSDLTTTGAVTTGGLTIPALAVRRVESTLELPSGGSMIMAGLIQADTRSTLDGVPGIKNAPVLGALFRSRDFVNEETELVVIATPYLVYPAGVKSLQSAADGVRVANDAAAIFLGKINDRYRVQGADASGKTWRGPIGFVVE